MLLISLLWLWLSVCCFGVCVCCLVCLGPLFLLCLVGLVAWLLGCFGAVLDCWLFLICLLVNSVGMICLNSLVLGVCFLLCCWISSS